MIIKGKNICKWNTAEQLTQKVPQWKYRLETVSNKLLGEVGRGGGMGGRGGWGWWVSETPQNS